MKKNKGITLIALVITIIVLLILAGVTISLVLNGGLLDQAQNAVSQTDEAAIKEKAVLALAEAKMDGYAKGLNGALGNLPAGYSISNGVLTTPEGKTYSIDENYNIKGESSTEAPPEGTSSDWDVSADGTLTKYKGTLTETITIPSVVDGIQVKKILGSTGSIFLGNSNGGTYAQVVKKVIVSSGITEIGNYAFAYVTNIEEVVLPSGLTTIGDYSFVGCTNLKTIVFPTGLDGTGRGAFSNCTSLQTITIPYEMIPGWHCFSGCDSLSIVVDNSEDWFLVHTGSTSAIWDGGCPVTWLRND